MKKVGYLYEKMLDKEYIKEQIITALKHKRKSETVIEILSRIDEVAQSYYDEISTYNYQFEDTYSKTIINCGKERDIQVPTIKDHIMHHIIMGVLKPIIEKGMYKWNCGVIPKRGPLYAKRYLEKVIRVEKPKYVLKIDVKKYFHNIDTNILLNLLSRKIKDKQYLNLLENLFNQANNNTGKGIPIGFYTSQWLSNFYLQGLDYYIKQELKVDYYCRYMDDLVLLGNNKRKLHIIKRKIFNYLKESLNLEPNNNHQVFLHEKRHIDFVGYLFYSDKTKLRKKTFKLFKRRLNKIKSGSYNIHHCRSYMSLRGWLIHSNCGRHYLNRNESNKLYKKIKEYISIIDKGELNYELCKSN